MAEIWNLSALCRCCHKDGQFTDLRTLLQDSDTRNYVTLLQDTFNISMNVPLFGVSYAICDTCIEDLIQAHNFKVQVVGCEQKFHEYCQNELATQFDMKEEVESVHGDVSDDNDNHGFDDFEPEQNDDHIEFEVEDLKPALADNPKDKDENQKVIEPKKINRVGRPKKIKRGRKKLIPDVPIYRRLTYLLPEEQKYVKDEGDKRICTLCDYVYKTYYHSAYRKHLQEEHSINIEYRCDACEKIFNSFVNFNTHNLNKHPEDTKPKPKPDKQLKIQKPKPKPDKQLKIQKPKPELDKHLRDKKIKPIIDKRLKDHEPKLKPKRIRPRMQSSTRFQCKHCPRKYNLLKRLNEHSKIHEKVDCTSCKKAFDNKDLYEKHVCVGLEPIKVINEEIGNKPKIENKNGDNKTENETKDITVKKEKFFCKQCKFRTFTYNKLVYHDKARHQTDKKYYCDLCVKEFAYKKSLQFHLAAIHYNINLKKVICEFCGLGLNDVGIYNVHRKTVHENIRAFICDLCPLTFKLKKALKIHMLKHTGVRPHKCDECKKAFFDGHSLKMHKKTHEEGRMDRLLISRYEKNVAEGRMDRQGQEGSTTPLRVVCKMCKEIFPRKGALLKHYNTVHRSSLPHKCEYCPKRFANKYTKKRHMNIHLGITFTCPICKEKYKQRSTLQRHIKSIHELGNQKSYVKLQKCLECNRNYGDYEKHKRFHQNPLVRCEVCKKPYSNQSVLNRHMATLHGSTKVYECKPCQKKFLRLRGYQRHLKKKHHNADLFKNGIVSSKESDTEMDENKDFEIEIEEFKSNTVGTESKCTIRQTTGTTRQIL